MTALPDAEGFRGFFMGRRNGWRLGCSFFSFFLSANLLFVAGCDSSVRSSYATASEARSGDVGRGWISTVLPDSAYAIFEVRDPEDNTGIGSFRFRKDDDHSFRASLEASPAPQLDRITANHAKLQRKGYVFYAASEFILAVNWQARHVQFWFISNES